jgi:hypothetical protein
LRPAGRRGRNVTPNRPTSSSLTPRRLRIGGALTTTTDPRPMNSDLHHHTAKAQTAELLRQAQRRGSVTVTRPRLRLRAAIRRTACRLSTTSMRHRWSAFRRRFAFVAVAFAFLVLLAFSTAPSPLYVLYAHRDHFSALVITLIYAAYAIGVVCSLFFVSHLSDLHGRRPHLLLAVAIDVVSGALFIAWPSLPGLFVARILSGISVGLTVSTATAYLDELHRAQRPQSSVARPQLTATAANLGASASAPWWPVSLPSMKPIPSCSPTWCSSGCSSSQESLSPYRPRPVTPRVRFPPTAPAGVRTRRRPPAVPRRSHRRLPGLLGARRLHRPGRDLPRHGRA